MKETTVKHEPEKQKTDQDIKVIRKGFKGPAKPKREYFIDDIIPDGI